MTILVFIRVQQYLAVSVPSKTGVAKLIDPKAVLPF